MPRRIKRRSETLPHPGRNNLSLHRPTSREQGYDSAWDRVAKRRREIDHYLCQACLAIDRLTASTDVDHIIPLHVRYDWRLEIDNTQVLCRMHHRRKTRDDNLQYGSSTTTTLTPAQQNARDAARALPEPPRSPRGGTSFQEALSLRNVADPARVSPRNWGGG